MIHILFKFQRKHRKKDLKKKAKSNQISRSSRWLRNLTYMYFVIIQKKHFKSDAFCSGKMCCFIGGPKETYENHKLILDASFPTQFYMGEIGSATITKVNNKLFICN